MSRTHKSTATLASAAYEVLRADLLSCRLRPGEPIKIKEISSSLGMNTIAIREALSKLTSEGLVTAEPQKGFRATPISKVELLDLTKTRVKIEHLCLQSAITHGGISWETGIVAALHGLLRAPLRAADDPKRNSDEWASIHETFHLSLVSACDSPLLLGFRDMLYAQSERYRRLSLPLAEFNRDINAEHKELADAVIQRKTVMALALMERHLQKTTDILLHGNHCFL